MKLFLMLLACPLLLLACSEQKQTDYGTLPLTDSKLISRGQYLVAITGCNDCHSPKMMTDKGPVPDPSLLLSGHPEKMPMAPFDSVTSKNWLLFNMNLSAFKGPWGTSFAANLTPDDSGIGNWSEEQFSNALRKGYFKGLAGSRQLMPPMPWQGFAEMTDADVHAIFAYLKSIRPVSNYVPAVMAPGS